MINLRARAQIIQPDRQTPPDVWGPEHEVPVQLGPKAEPIGPLDNPKLYKVGRFLMDVGGMRQTVYVYPPGVPHVKGDPVIEGAGGWRMLIMFMGVSQEQLDDWAELAASGAIKLDTQGYPVGCSRPPLGGLIGKAVAQ